MKVYGLYAEGYYTKLIRVSLNKDKMWSEVKSLFKEKDICQISEERKCIKLSCRGSMAMGDGEESYHDPNSGLYQLLTRYSNSNGDIESLVIKEIPLDSKFAEYTT